ncbi:hypothetical protein E4T39_03361 [Aureobasidium subglaciale]|nr:hypothetical protein E4T39_03361 [Aureobasidium subglaciale]
MTTNIKDTGLTDGQNRYLALAWVCFEVEPKIDFDKLSLVSGSKTANSAREMLRVAKKKLSENITASTGDTSGTIAPPNTPATKTPKKKAIPKTQSTKGKGAKKRKVTANSGDEDDQETPTKQKIVVKNEPAEEDSDAGAGAGASDNDDEV